MSVLVVGLRWKNGLRFLPTKKHGGYSLLVVVRGHKAFIILNPLVYNRTIVFYLGKTLVLEILGGTKLGIRCQMVV